MNKMNWLVRAFIGCLLVILLTSNYMTSLFDGKNKPYFEDFGSDSEELVTSVLRAERENIPIDCYGLGTYEKIGNEIEPYTDDNWDRGYSRTSGKVIIQNDSYNLGVAVAGNYVQFENGESYLITNTEVSEYFLVPILQTDEPLDPETHGDISGISFLDNNRNPIPKAQVKPYVVQFGLQGKVFRHLTLGMTYDTSVKVLHFLCAFGMAVTAVLIVWLIYKKYNFLMAGCFYITFLLSRWIVNFARNLYWVECLWFLPMLIGLFCAYKVNCKTCRIISYVAAFLSIAVKCLCGYEYITAIMLGLIAFLLVDLLKYIAEKDTQMSMLLFRTIVLLGISALLGFAVAICMHANFRGNGNLLEGLRSIYEQDVLRRTWGGDINNFPEYYRDSFEATVFQVLARYFRFGTEIITGVSGKLFPILCIAPLGIFAYDIYRKKINIELVGMYLILFVTCISWFVLGKSHSAEHPHINFVMWYFGFVQICFYIICNWLINILKRKIRGNCSEATIWKVLNRYDKGL